MVGFAVVYFGYIMRALERPYVSDSKAALDMEYLTNGWWLAIITITTIGYGDGYPGTHLGRGSAMVLGVFGAFYLSLCILTFRTLAFLDEREVEAFYMVKRYEEH
jgi:hypothetical protein